MYMTGVKICGDLFHFFIIILFIDFIFSFSQCTQTRTCHIVLFSLNTLLIHCTLTQASVINRHSEDLVPINRVLSPSPTLDQGCKKKKKSLIPFNMQNEGVKSRLSLRCHPPTPTVRRTGLGAARDEPLRKTIQTGLCSTDRHAYEYYDIKPHKVNKSLVTREAFTFLCHGISLIHTGHK